MHLDGGDRFVVPEIADYEVRRELLRAEKLRGLQRLDELCVGFGFQPLSSAIMREAAVLWADARNAGMPTAHDAALDGDVILAAQARSLVVNDEADDVVVVATTNTKHLKRYVDARLWTEI